MTIVVDEHDARWRSAPVAGTADLVRFLVVDDRDDRDRRIARLARSAFALAAANARGRGARR